jgi:hypothetical protein
MTQTYTNAGHMVLREAFAKLPSLLGDDTQRDTCDGPFVPTDLTYEHLLALGEDFLQPAETDPVKYRIALNLLRGATKEVVATCQGPRPFVHLETPALC